ncbi:MAG TPA: hypothetical protein VKT75_16170 [Acidobacteriaceae bacterium]|nr:hypothetical protein [Acidobacteriaceae bacterium]
MKLGRMVQAAVTAVLAITMCCAVAQPHSADWRQATDAELKSVIPARAPVVTERIETEMRSASGITNGKGKYIAGVVLITAGYSAEGKYSHFFLTQVPLRLDNTVQLPAGEYVIGYEHGDNGLLVHFYEASTGKPVGSLLAKLIPGTTRVEAFRIWPSASQHAGASAEHAMIQIGRFGFSYQIGG